MKVVLILLCSAGGTYLVVRGFLRNFKEIKAKPGHTNSDKYFNYPLMVLWYSYLLIFCLGLIVNNLVLH